MVTNLLWVLQHPTPYNTYLLNQLGSRLGMDVEAVYRWPELSSHPWSVLPARHFGWRVVARPGERDAELERRCATDHRTFIVFAGWRDRTIRPALMARARSRSPFAFWTDTPKTTGGLLRRVLDGAFVHFARRAVTTLATGVPAVERYRAVGVPDDRLENFPFVVDPEHFGGALVVRSGRRAGGSVGFLIPARLVDRLKGQSVALEALRIAREHTQGVRLELILAGVGPDGDRLRLVASELHVADAVRFEGWVEYAAMPALLGAVDALVLPSHWDPFPVAVIEAMAAGLPIIAGGIGPIAELTDDGVEARFWPLDNPEQAAVIAVELLGSEEARAKAGTAALERFRRDYSAAVLGPQIRSFLLDPAGVT